MANRLKQLMTREFDVLVIGTGTSGYTLALACREAERSVAVADNRPYGGTCAMRGCQPKKYLRRPTTVDQNVCPRGGATLPA
jgi:glutathione reductase (NADPH)